MLSMARCVQSPERLRCFKACAKSGTGDYLSADKQAIAAIASVDAFSMVRRSVTAQVCFDLTAEVAENAEKSVDQFQISDCRLQIFGLAICNLQSAIYQKPLRTPRSLSLVVG